MLLSSANAADAPQNDRSSIAAGMQGARLGRDAKPLYHWNVLPVERLAREKLGTVSSEGEFSRTTMEFTKYYKEVDFRVVGSGRQDEGLYSRMMAIFHEAQRDLEV